MTFSPDAALGHHLLEVPQAQATGRLWESTMSMILAQHHRQKGGGAQLLTMIPHQLKVRLSSIWRDKWITSMALLLILGNCGAGLPHKRVFGSYEDGASAHNDLLIDKCMLGGAILAKYQQSDGPSGSLGLCLTDELATSDGAGRYAHFQEGSIYWTPATGAHAVQGAIRDQWWRLQLGKEGLGYPLSDELTASDGIGRIARFESGEIHFSPSTGAHDIRGTILTEWVRLGAERGRLGYPLTGEYDVPEGRQSTFQGGSLRFNRSLSQVDVIAPVGPPNGIPETSTLFSTVYIDEKTTLPVLGDGDLWPSCWSSDGALYTANGDGWGMDFGTRTWADLVVSRINGEAPGLLTGVPLARGGQVSDLWLPSGNNRKPTGLVCAGGDLYLAVQDLALDFEAAETLSISRSTDKGRTWTWNRSAPMFGNSAFTTIMFLDYGQDNANAKDGYVYAYGIDHNWRFSARVPDPDKLYLGRVPTDRILDRMAWEFFIGTDPAGKPSWSHDIQARQPVLEDRSRAFAEMVVNQPAWPGPMTKIAQGGIFYNGPLNRYIYTSWTRFSWEFYEAPQPWGPWRHFISKNFGVYPWTEAKHGGYAPSVPTKYLSADGKSFYVQANTFLSGVHRYGFALRQVRLEPYLEAIPTNSRDSVSLASAQFGTVVFSYSNHFGSPSILNDSLVAGQSEDSWNGEAKLVDFWGYTWPRPYNFNRVEYSTGQMTKHGGWFEAGFKIQVRQRGNWVDILEACSSPPYLGSEAAGNTTYIFAFDDTWGDGVRILGRPGGDARYTSIAELDVYYTDAQGPVCEL